MKGFAPALLVLLALTACRSGDNAGYRYEESNGLLVIEAERWTQLSDQTQRWAEISVAGSEGTAVKLPADALVLEQSDANPSIQYNFSLNSTATRYLWVRGRQTDTQPALALNLADDNGQLSAFSLAFPTPTWQWQQATKNSTPLAIPTAAGDYQLSISATSAAISVDRILLTSNADFVPTGIGPQATFAQPKEDTDSGNRSRTIIVVPTGTLRASAGPDARLSAPGSLTLNGSVTSNSTTAPTLQWEYTSGPAEVLFANAAQAQTTAQFTSPGEYTLAFSAAVNNSTSSDRLHVTVDLATNLAPQTEIQFVSANSTPQNHALQLFANASDDGKPNGALYYWWSMLNGPGTASFSSQNAADTAVTFSHTGQYTLQLSVHDGDLNSVVNSTVSVTEPDGNSIPLQPWDAQAAASLVVDPGNDLASASTYTAGSFVIHNHSASANITQVTIDLSTAAINDIVFDPEGNAGDSAFKPLSIDSGAVESGFQSSQFSSENAGGYDKLELNFNDFAPGEQVTFSIDLDPSNTRGVAPPGDRHAASVSGFELSGATVEAQFGDGSSLNNTLFGQAHSATAATAALQRNLPTAPSIGLEGSADRADITTSNQRVLIHGAPSQFVRLAVSEAGLYLAGVPDGGYDVDPYEPNTIIKSSQYQVTLDSAGYASVDLQLSKSNSDAGYHIIQAVSMQGEVSSNSSNSIIVYRQ